MSNRNQIWLNVAPKNGWWRDRGCLEGYEEILWMERKAEQGALRSRSSLGIQQAGQMHLWAVEFDG